MFSIPYLTLETFLLFSTQNRLSSNKHYSWTDKATGEERAQPKVLVKELDVLESRAEAELRKGNAPRGGGTGTRTNRPSNVSMGYNTSDDYGDEDEEDPFSSVGSGGFFS